MKIPATTSIAVLGKTNSAAEFFPLPLPEAPVQCGTAVAMKLSQAAIVALGHMVDPAVEPEPVKMS